MKGFVKIISIILCLTLVRADNLLASGKGEIGHCFGEIVLSLFVYSV
jgi:hypothetical protein